MLDYKRAKEMVRELTREDGVLDYTPEQARLLLQVLRTLARGRPVSAQEIDVSPDGVMKVYPPEAVISIAVVDGDTKLTSVETIWMTFCQNIHFFATREEAVRWAAARDDIAILTPDEGYELGRQLTRRFLDQ